MQQISLDANQLIGREDYSQSANSLFHFMKSNTYIESAILKRALFPRYCFEDVRYLNLKVNEQEFNEIAVLQKCFCDIPLHKITSNHELILTDESHKHINSMELNALEIGNNHPAYYGSYAIAFSKKWCEIQNLQPIHYLSESSYTRDFRSLLIKAIDSDELADDIVADILKRLSLIKPLRGKMKRIITVQKDNIETNIEVEVIKNFHDEQEWRYIPDLNTINSISAKTYSIESIIANPNLIYKEIGPQERLIDRLSSELTSLNFRKMWLEFSYDDIRYLIVPDKQSRINLIDFIMELPDSNFEQQDNINQQRYILISKILVLDEIRKDW